MLAECLSVHSMGKPENSKTRNHPAALHFSLTVKQGVKKEICKCVLLQILLFSETVAYFTIKTLILQHISAVGLSKCDR